MFNIAIDGPAGAGKSTIAKELSKKLGFTYVDTGAMFRAMAYDLIQRGIHREDMLGIEAALTDMQIGLQYEDGKQHIFVNGKDVSDIIRTEEIGGFASSISVFPKVREKLLEMQRDIAKKQNVVMDGRDIGTVVLPHADLKIYLTASIEERARRRYKELLAKGMEVNLSDIEEEIKLRDERDMNREVAPLKQADDAIYLDSSDMKIEEVIEYIYERSKTR